MRPRRLAALAIGPALLAAGTASGADDAHGGGPSFFEYMWQAINLALLLGIIVWFARRPITTFFGERRAQIQGDIDSAADFLKESEERYGEWQRKLAHLDSELEQIRAHARQRAHEEADRVLADARATAERIQNDARAAVDQEVRRAQEELRNEASDLAVELAAGILREQVGDDDRKRLLDEFIQRIEREPAPGANGRSA